MQLPIVSNFITKETVLASLRNSDFLLPSFPNLGCGRDHECRHMAALWLTPGYTPENEETIVPMDSHLLSRDRAGP